MASQWPGRETWGRAGITAFAICACHFQGHSVPLSEELRSRDFLVSDILIEANILKRLLRETSSPQQEVAQWPLPQIGVGSLNGAGRGWWKAGVAPRHPDSSVYSSGKGLLAQAESWYFCHLKSRRIMGQEDDLVKSLLYWCY